MEGLLHLTGKKENETGGEEGLNPLEDGEDLAATYWSLPSALVLNHFLSLLNSLPFIIKL